MTQINRDPTLLTNSKTMKTITRWKFLNKIGRTIKSKNGDMKWKVGVWNKVDGELDLCSRGLHCSKVAYDAFSYVQGEVCALVECRGKHLSEDDKECWKEQRIIKAYKWTKKDSLKLAIFSAELVLKNFEKERPNDMRPREAIEVAKKVLFKDTARNRSAAWSAARSAESAAGYAESAAGYAAGYAARYAGYAAGSAAGYAARYAGYAAGYAARYAGYAAGSAAVKKIQKYFTKLVENLEEI